MFLVYYYYSAKLPTVWWEDNIRTYKVSYITISISCHIISTKIKLMDESYTYVFLQKE